MSLDYRDWADVVRILRTAKPYSGLDLAFITHQPLSFEQLATMADAFATSDLPIRVDVVDWASTSDAFRKIIERDRVVVQAP